MEKLPASELGTKDYWENVYRNELQCFVDHGENGEVWFGKSLAKKIVEWLRVNVDKSAAILEIGTGNGQLLMDLSKCGFVSLIGIDYSSEAINFANTVQRKMQINPLITFNECNFLSAVSEESNVFNTKYEVIIDKGTFDAICLNGDQDDKLIKSKYYNSVCKCLSNGGLFLLTSCNWTKCEILEQIKCLNCPLTLFTEIETPSFTFGGNQGNKVVSLIFKRT